MARDRKRHACDKEVLPTASPSRAPAPSAPPLATTPPEPHDCLIQIVRLLARQAAKADIAAQRSQTLED